MTAWLRRLWCSLTGHGDQYQVLHGLGPQPVVTVRCVRCGASKVLPVAIADKAIKDGTIGEWI